MPNYRKGYYRWNPCQVAWEAWRQVKNYESGAKPNTTMDTKEEVLIFLGKKPREKTK